MNEKTGQKTTVATIGGNPERLVFGARYNVRDGADRVLRNVELRERFPNGDLAFLEDPSTEYPDGRAFRVRPSRIDAIVPIGETPTESVISPRHEDETASAYLARLERGLGAGAYARWIASEDGQRALADAAAEDRAGRNGRVRRADPEKVVDVLSTIYPGVVATSRTVSLDDLSAEEANAVPKLTKRGKAKLVAAGADPEVVAASETVEEALAKPKGRPYAERNQVWRCGSCKRRTRAPFCENGHPRVDAPAGKRREDRGSK